MKSCTCCKPVNFEHAIACLEFVGSVVHLGNADRARMVGDAAGEREFQETADEFRSAAEALRAVQGLCDVTGKMREEEEAATRLRQSATPGQESAALQEGKP